MTITQLVWCLFTIAAVPNRLLPLRIVLLSSTSDCRSTLPTVLVLPVISFPLFFGEFAINNYVWNVTSLRVLQEG